MRNRTKPAVVSNGGIALDERLVATYRAQADPLPPRPRDLLLERRGNTVVVTWTSPRRLQHHDIRVRLGSGHAALRIHHGTRDRIVVHGVRPRTRVRVTVVARDELLRASRPAHARLHPRQPHS
jgi:hypothetical protein